MDKAIINKNSPKIFNDFLTFLHNNDELTSEEEILFNNKAHEFFKTLEITKMTMSYKIPILIAFYNNGKIKMEITEDDVYKSMYSFYSKEKYGKDLLKHENTKNYKTWTPKEYINHAKKNPIKNLNKTEHEFFKTKKGFALALTDEIEEFIDLDSFKQHFKDIIEYRTKKYFNEDIK